MRKACRHITFWTCQKSCTQYNRARGRFGDATGRIVALGAQLLNTRFGSLSHLPARDKTRYHPRLVMRWPASSHVFEGWVTRGPGAPGPSDLAASAAESVADQRFLPRHSTTCQSVDRCDGVKATPSAANGGIRIIVLGW